MRFRCFLPAGMTPAPTFATPALPAPALTRSVLALAALAVLAVPSAGPSQVAEIRAEASLLPDTAHVGEPFRLGVILRVPRGVEVRFSQALEVTEDLEQVGEPQIGRRRPRTGVLRAYYRVVAWKAGPHHVPPVMVEVLSGGEGSEPYSMPVPVPQLTVETVLPAEVDGLELRQALPFLNPLPFPWLAVLILLALLVGWWAYRRYGRREEEPEAVPRRPLTAWERALAELRKLVEDWHAGEVTHDVFCDRLEAILKRYLADTERWAPGIPVRAVVNGNRRLAQALYYSARVRFARLAGAYGGPIEASDACQAWIASRHERIDAETAGEGEGESEASAWAPTGEGAG